MTIKRMTDPKNSTEGRYLTRSAKKSSQSDTTSHESTSSVDYDSVVQQVHDQGHSSTDQPVELQGPPASQLLNETPSEIDEGDFLIGRQDLTTPDRSRSDQEEGELELNYHAEAMAENLKSLGPDNFSGLAKEDLNKFLQTFELWATFRKYDEPTKVAALPLLLKESASIWYGTLRPAVKNDYNRLKAALLERYGPNQNQTWKNVADLWKMKQGEGQSCNDYISKIEQEANRLNCPPETTFMVAMNGLRPVIRQMVTIQNLSNLEHLKKLGRLVEESSQDASMDMQGTLTELRELAGQLKFMQIQAIQPQQEHQTSTESASSRPSNQPWFAGNRGRFSQSAGFRGRAPRGHGQSWGQQTTNPPWSTAGRGHGKPGFRGQHSSSTNPEWSNNQTRQRGYANYSGRPTFNNRNCYACGLPGHIQSQCSNARYQQ